MLLLKSFKSQQILAIFHQIIYTKIVLALIRLIIYTTYSRNRKQALQCIRNTTDTTEIVIIEKNTLSVQSFANFSESSFLLKLEEWKETDRC